MGYHYLDIASTPSVKAAQAANGSRDRWERFEGDRGSNRFTDDEVQFIATRDSFYIATVSESGWPYVQHRGGAIGFLKVLDERTLGFADYRGNRQYISLGNVAANDRAALILMDYPRRARLKIYARVEIKDLPSDPALAERLFMRGYEARPERGILLRLEAFDWNCQQHITPRFTEAELEPALTRLHVRLQQLEAENAALRQKLAEAAGPAA